MIHYFHFNPVAHRYHNREDNFLKPTSLFSSRPCSHGCRSKRSKFMTLSQAPTKSRTNLSPESELP